MSKNCMDKFTILSLRYSCFDSHFKKAAKGELQHEYNVTKIKSLQNDAMHHKWISIYNNV